VAPAKMAKLLLQCTLPRLTMGNRVVPAFLIGEFLTGHCH